MNQRRRTQSSGGRLIVDEFDVFVVGRGASGAFLIRDLLAPGGGVKSLRVAAIDRSPTGDWGGAAYGPPSGEGALLITELGGFLAGPEKARFVDWLHAIDPARTGDAAPDWWPRNLSGVLARGDVDSEYLPRRLFGRYLNEVTERAVADAVGIVKLDQLQGSVTDITFDGVWYHVHVGVREFRARAVVLAVGSIPTATVLGNHQLGPAMGIDRPYEPSLDETMAAAATRLQSSAEPHVVLLGANATTFDVLYALTRRPELMTVPHCTVVSPGGKLPTQRRNPPQKRAALAGLERLGREPRITADDIHAAAVAELAANSSLHPSDVIESINAQLNDLVQQLPPAELEKFVDDLGVEIGRHTRRAGAGYFEVANELMASGKLDLVKGRFTGVSAEGHVRIEAGPETEPVMARADVVINGTGAATVTDADANPLVAKLVASGLVNPTRNNRGIEVNADFAAAPGLFVHGPLLAGNIIGSVPVWHLEHCGRIHAMSPAVVAAIRSHLEQAAVPAPSA